MSRRTEVNPDFDLSALRIGLSQPPVDVKQAASEFETPDPFCPPDEVPPRFWALRWLVKRHSFHLRWSNGLVSKYHHVGTSLGCPTCSEAEYRATTMKADAVSKNLPQSWKRCKNRPTAFGWLVFGPVATVTLFFVLVLIFKR